jgi:hypothetical protein
VNGILQELKKTKSNSILFDYSSIGSGKSENLLNSDDFNFHSRNQPNQWVSLKFNTKKVFLSGYFLRSRFGASNSFNLKS